MKLESYQDTYSFESSIALIPENKEECSILLIISRKYPYLFDLKALHKGGSYYSDPRMKLIFKYSPESNIGEVKRGNDMLDYSNYYGGNVTSSSIVGVQDETENAEEIMEKEESISPSPPKSE